MYMSPILNGPLCFFNGLNARSKIPQQTKFTEKETQEQEDRRKSCQFDASTSIKMAQDDDLAELAEHGVPFWAMQNEDALKIFRLSAALNKKVHERVAKMKQVSRLGFSAFQSIHIQV